MTSFHNEPFDNSTKIKLEVFQKYIREWLPVFMVKDEDINVFDLFSGPGYDSKGTPGTPIILVKEIKEFCEKRAGSRGKSNINITFNDKDAKCIEMLKDNLDLNMCDKGCCSIELLNSPFSDIIPKILKELSTQLPSLVILDQFGVSDVTPELVDQFSACPRTDIMFFISSSYIHRFKEQLGPKIGLISEEKNIDYNTIHKHICSHFKSSLSLKGYHLAPFSIKKDRNIYGIIFGSSNLLGLEKFLKVCWSLDDVNGEANYNIYGEDLYDGQLCLFQDNSEVSKVTDFKKKLLEFLNEKRNNIEVYIFCVENGFSVPRSNDVLSDLQRDKKIVVKKMDGSLARKGAFYLGYSNYKESSEIYMEKV